MTDEIKVNALQLVSDTEEDLTLWFWEDLINLKRSQAFLTEDEAEMAESAHPQNGIATDIRRIGDDD